MNLEPLAPLSQGLASEAQITKKTSGEGFADILNDAIKSAASTEFEDDAGMIALLSGMDIEPHESMIQSTQAELALNLAIQIRNKVVDSYNEVMRMQI